jgi:hypothetical protein
VLARKPHPLYLSTIVIVEARTNRSVERADARLRLNGASWRAQEAGGFNVAG